jgi:hypothetical protein
VLGDISVELYHACFPMYVDVPPLGKFINPDTCMVLFGFDTPTHNLPQNQTNLLFAHNTHPLLYCISVFAHAAPAIHPAIYQLI